MNSRPLWISGSIALIAASLYLAREPILFGLGQAMVYSEAPVHADAIVVLGGDYAGRRILKAAQLVKDGYAPVVLVSGAPNQYGFHESTLAIDFAVRKGYARETMVPILFPAVSTLDESRADTEALRQRGAHTYLLVTSFSHTARARRAFRRAAPDLEFHTVAAPQGRWHGGRWWIDREGRKIWLYEAMKTVADFFRI